METKEIKIEIPEGYEVDKEKSTFENIVFKKKKTVNCWEDLLRVVGVYINDVTAGISELDDYPTSHMNKNVFLNEKYAKSALALAQISQLLPYYDSKVDWSKFSPKWIIIRESKHFEIVRSTLTYNIMAFNTYAEAARFLKHNEQLVRDYYMMED